MIDVPSIFKVGKFEQLFNELTVHQRVLCAGSRAIAITNVSFVELIRTRKSKLIRGILFCVASILLFLGIYMATQHNAFSGPPIEIIFTVFALSAFFLWLAVRRDKFILVIATTDGSRTSFQGKDKKLLKTAFDYLIYKIDSGDESATTVFNFNNSNLIGSNVGRNISTNGDANGLDL